MLLAGWVALVQYADVWIGDHIFGLQEGLEQASPFDRFISHFAMIWGFLLVVIQLSGIATNPKSDALPVVFDEAEFNEKADQTRMQSYWHWQESK